jgi:hypothetical protein
MSKRAMAPAISPTTINITMNVNMGAQLPRLWTTMPGAAEARGSRRPGRGPAGSVLHLARLG